MLIMRYCGGLGNQMFQYALQTSLSNMYPNQTIKMDLHHYNFEKEHNGFELDRYFSVHVNTAEKYEIRRLFNGYIPGKFTSMLPIGIKKILVLKGQYYYWRVFNHIYPQKRKYLIQDGECDTYNETVNNLSSGDFYLRGLWQNTRYFDDYRNDIIQVFDFKCEVNEVDTSIIEELEKGDTIAVHIRGGDFLNPAYNLCGENYYKKAISSIYESINKNLPLYVFTDDKTYANKLLSDYKIKKIISHGVNQSDVDMFMLTKSKFLVLSNSTFSFWGGYLNQLDDSEIICPRFATYINGNYREFPSRTQWKKIDNCV